MTEANPLSREEYIEQEYFFRVFRERLLDNLPSQEILKTIHEEVLATCQLPMAIDILRTEILHSGRIGPAMAQLSHYFSAFQTFVIDQAEDEQSRFEQRSALQILEREARYRSGEPTAAGLFMYQFECVARNRLGYRQGLTAMLADPLYDQDWKRWMQYLTRQIGAHDLPDLVYRASEFYRQRKAAVAGTNAPATEQPALFELQAGRIARANIGRDPQYFFRALQRQLNYPVVPAPVRTDPDNIPAAIEARLVRIEQRMKLVEMEQRGGIDLSKFYGKHREFDDT